MQKREGDPNDSLTARCRISIPAARPRGDGRRPRRPRRVLRRHRAPIGRPGGSQAVGQALGRNPVPMVIPCHRVVAAGGRIGGYMEGLGIKRALLRIEGLDASRTERIA
jgi:O-6-methylguanine DNA methyltransferase